MVDRIDDLHIKDEGELIGLPGRFYEDQYPLDVSTVGIEMPQDESVAAYTEGVGRTWGEMLRGALAGTLGAGGDVEKIVYGVKNLIDTEMGKGEGEKFLEGGWESFLEGFQEEAYLPTTEEVSQALPEIPGNEDQEAAKNIGEMLGPGGVVNAARVAASKTAREIASKSSSQAAASGTAAATIAPTAEGATQQEFYNALAKNMETMHGLTPVVTADAAEANKSDKQKSLDIGYGHKIKRNTAEWKSGKIYGIPFKDAQGNFIPLTEDQAMEILVKDYEKNLAEARKGRNGWDAKLKKIGSSWNQLAEPYQQALASLAYNVGGTKAKEWEKIFPAAVNQDVREFAKQLRRQDGGKWTKGMDNRVAKELYYSGIIKGLRDVQNELPLAEANSAGIPK